MNILHFPIVLKDSRGEVSFGSECLRRGRHVLGLALVVAGMGLSQAALGQQAVGAAPVTLAWDANTETDLAGYRVHLGQASGQPTSTFEAGRDTTITLDTLTPGETYYVVVTAYNTSGMESLPSEEIAFTALSLEPTFAMEPMSAPPAGDPALTASAATITQGKALENGGYAFVITANPGQTLAVYASGDMLNWELLGTTTNPTGRLQAIDPSASGENSRFYQVVPQQP